jgi:hypothetical protein
MGRWPSYIGISDRRNGSVYLKRWRFVSTPWCGVFLHHILREDWARDVHDHPWDFVSIRLLGTYDEHLYRESLTGLPVRDEVQTSRRVTFRRATQLHRIARLNRDRGVWTLILRGRRQRQWGFQTDDGWVPEYEYENGAWRAPGSQP